MYVAEYANLFVQDQGALMPGQCNSAQSEAAFQSFRQKNLISEKTRKNPLRIVEIVTKFYFIFLS